MQRNIEIYIWLQTFKINDRHYLLCTNKTVRVRNHLNMYKYLKPSKYEQIKLSVFDSNTWNHSIVIWLVSLFNGISTFVGYLMPKPFS